MEVIKVYMKEDGTAPIKCPKCSTVRVLDVSTYSEQKKILKIKCSCKEIFGVALESRKSYRKETNLYGKCIDLSRSNVRDDIIIKDVSMNGIGFTVISGKHTIKEKDTIRVEFKLDDEQNSFVERDAVVKLVDDNFIGCEFSDNRQYNRALGFYLMP